MQIHDFKQYSAEWWEARSGKPSASSISKSITSTGKESKSLNDYAIELANDLYSGFSTGSDFKSRDMERGTKMEPEARLSFQIEEGKEVKEIGIITDGDMCASPDGLIKSGGTLEIKCLIGVHHTKALIYIAKNNRCPTAYYAQIQMQIMVSGEEFGYLYLYHPILPCKSFKVEKNNEFCNELKRLIIKTNIKKKEVLEFLNN